MKKKLIMALLATSMVCTILPSHVYATEIGTSGDTYVEEENREENTENEGNASYVEPGQSMSKEEFYNSLNNTENGNGAPTNEDVELDLSGEGQLRLAIEVSDTFYENIQVSLYNRDTRETIKVPVYASNKWIENVQIPAGRYLVSNVLAGGDNIENPKWVFEMGSSVDVDTNGVATLNVKLLKGPDYVSEPDNDITVPTDGVTDTDITQDLTEEKLTVGQQVVNFFKSLVTGSNFIILAVLAGSSVGYLYLKKKREGQ